MAASTIIVSYPDGSPAANTRVSLLFDHGGMTPNHFTNSQGEVTIRHSGIGKATIFVNGNRSGAMNAPGTSSAVIQ
ncbi:MAG: hypothetical protein AAF558_00020 [Verrucomicrobiota bacterium]